jgi:hypothetical protein
MNKDNRNMENRPADMANKGRGMQGIDKAPGEETAQSAEQFISETQKGKNKVDGDLSMESDRPLDRQEIDE